MSEDDKIRVISRLLELPEDILVVVAPQIEVPKDIDSLVHSLGSYGEVAKEYAIWSSVSRWLREQPDAVKDPVRTKRRLDVVAWYAASQYHRLGFPGRDASYPLPEYDGFHRSRRDRVKREALAVRAGWAAAGQPRVEQAIAPTYSYFRSLITRGK